MSRLRRLVLIHRKQVAILLQPLGRFVELAFVYQKPDEGRGGSRGHGRRVDRVFRDHGQHPPGRSAVTGARVGAGGVETKAGLLRRAGPAFGQLLEYLSQRLVCVGRALGLGLFQELLQRLYRRR